ncbi:MAG: hypothetical protein OEM41_04415, partial [Ignavibacteria bacterium]|nr:hypothetical protein [Ignavibacteria bacterium]
SFPAMARFALYFDWFEPDYCPRSNEFGPVTCSTLDSLMRSLKRKPALSIVVKGQLPPCFR